MQRFAVFAIAGLVACSAGRLARAEAPSPPTKEGIDFFEQKIRPVLVNKCYECHSEAKKKVKGKLRLDDYASMLKGGESGKRAVVPGKPDESQLIFSMTYTDKDTADHDALLMPPPKNGRPRKLPDSVIDDFRAWIKMGAPYPPGGAKSEATPAGSKEHWAFVAPEDWPLPRVKETAWVKDPIDRFVLAKLEAQNLHPSNPADKRTLIRRATFDLIGLPPTEAEVQAFEANSSPDAFQKVVDRLLASPRYGERWGRYWLDVARYADTKGYVFEEERRYPYSYTYRDWVIGAFNEDLPYDQFIIDQIAADKLDRHEDGKSLAAEGFLTVGRRFLNYLPDIVDDRIDVVCRGMMAMTVGCARCHDHKFDPISQKDYYSLYSVFANSIEPKDPPLAGEPEKTPEYREFQEELSRKEALIKAYQDETLAAHMAALRSPQKIAAYLLAAHAESAAEKPGVVPFVTHRWRRFLKEQSEHEDAIFAAWRDYADLPADAFASASARITAKLHDSRHLNPLVAQAFAEPPVSISDVAERYGKLLASFDGAKPQASDEKESLRLVLRGPDSPTLLTTADAAQILEASEQQHYRALARQAEEFQATSPAAPPRAMCLEDASSIAPQHVFLRGNPSNQGDLVQPHFLAVLCDGSPKPFTNGSGRLDLARDIASKSNPLTARVMVNRIWLHHFGQGIVRTPSDFGTRSDPPTHPELLDWLAVRFMEEGWSIKKMQKLIMLSATYQQSSEVDPMVTKADPDNRLLSHFNRQRLDWEATRDALLATAGQLDTKIGGRPVEILDSNRRTVYGFIDRQNLPGVFRSFDYASPDATSPQRFVTTVPQQALFLMNSPFVAREAQDLVRRLETAHQTDPVQRIAALYQAIFQRIPTSDELALGGRFIASDPAQRNEIALVWQYGYGAYNQTTHRTGDFQTLSHFTGRVWQGGSSFPDPALGYLLLTATGGHPGQDVQHAAIRRWTSPIDGVVHIRGTISHNQSEGDGVRGRIVSSRFGELASWIVMNMEASTDLGNIRVHKGDTLDFMVDCRDTDYFDSFNWAPTIEVASAPVAGNDGPAVWSAQAQFGASNGGRPNDIWVKYAQVLLETNEFVFID